MNDDFCLAHCKAGKECEISRLRAELVAKESARLELEYSYRYRQDEIASLRAELDAANLKLDEFQRKIWKLEPAARQDAKEKARLREALEGLLMDFDKLTQYGSPLARAANERTKAARAALACRPQEKEKNRT
jgi:chromosome segregation ATPase